MLKNQFQKYSIILVLHENVTVRFCIEHTTDVTESTSNLLYLKHNYTKDRKV
jgi:hypothetical protein